MYIKAHGPSHITEGPFGGASMAAPVGVTWVTCVWVNYGERKHSRKYRASKS